MGTTENGEFTINPKEDAAKQQATAHLDSSIIYNPLHLNFHRWMLTGQASDDFDEFPILNQDHHVLQLFSDLAGLGGGFDGVDGRAAYTVNPYAAAITALYNPFNDNEPYNTTISYLPNIPDEVTGLNIAVKAWTPDMAGNADAVKSWIDTNWDATAIDTKVDDFEAAQEAVLNQGTARVNAAFSELNASNSSAKALALSMTERDHTRVVANFRSELELGIENRSIDSSLDYGLKNATLELTHQQVKLAVFGIVQGAGMQFIGLKQQEVKDDLSMRLEDTLWRIKLHEFTGAYLTSMTGGSGVARTQNETLAGIQDIAAIGSAGVDLVTGGFQLGNLIASLF